MTGGTTGIGAASAHLFRDEGATVIVTGTNPATLAAVQAPGIDAIRCDQSSLADLDLLMAEIGAPNWLTAISASQLGIAPTEVRRADRNGADEARRPAWRNGDGAVPRLVRFVVHDRRGNRRFGRPDVTVMAAT